MNRGQRSLKANCSACLCVVCRQCDHGYGGGANRPDQGAAPAGALLLLGHAGVGLLYCRYDCANIC